MIKLSLPPEGGIYTLFNGFCVGPLSPGTSAEDDPVVFRADIDALTEGLRSFHETDVGHYKAEGEFYFRPLILVSEKAASSSDLDRISMKCYINNTANVQTMFFNNGYGHAGSIGRSSTGTRHCVVAGGAASADIIMLDRIPATITLNTVLTIRRYKYQFVRMNGPAFVFRQDFSEGKVRPFDLAKTDKEFDVDSSLFSACWNKATDVVPLSGSGQEASYSSFRAVSDAPLSIQSFRGWVNTRLIPELESAKTPLKGEDFGVLAQEASANVNRNQTNMIAFLRDLRNPKALVPKLKNLAKLKTHASNYLAINYGVLPTLSDLKEIMAALKSRQPYLDRHGWRTYTASRTSSSEQNEITFSLTQRIKIAIEDEDNDFVQLVNNVESSGFAPTLENIWDLIPYSFVIDWFINIGDFLERVDSRMRLSRLNIRYATMSSKSSKAKRIIPSQSYPFDGTISLVQYTRWTTDHCPAPPLFFQNTNTVSNHWLEASALIIQRTK